LKNLLKNVGIGIGLLLAMLLAWGLIEPRTLDVEYEEIAIAGLPDSWSGQRVAQLSDFQIGMWLDNPDTAEDAVEAAVAATPALVLLSGDFVYHPKADDKIAEDMEAVAEIVRPLIDAGIPTFAVLGNHDYAMAYEDSEPNYELANRVTSTLRQAGVIVLTNEATPLRPPSTPITDERVDPLYLVGIGSHYANNDDVDKALSGVPDGAARIVMMHHPDSFARFPANTAPLAVAGHTHGGQVRLPGLPSFSYQTFTKSDEVHVDGWTRDYGEDGNRLYINRGIGMSLVPIRINCAPELTLITLQRPETESEPMARE
jgi:predicted MPP superfamily phosphohydrolase